MTLKLEAGGAVSGSLSGGHINVNDDGDLTEASGGGGKETLKFEMRLTGDGEAQLHKIKPVPIRRK